MKIHKLKESTRSLMRSSFILTDLNSIVDELIANALDANATKIEISIDLDTFCLTVCDNGDGITFENMKVIAERYTSSKRANDTMRGITSIGYKGEALSSLSHVSMLHIISKNKYDDNTCAKLMRGGKVISLHHDTDPRDTHGTTVIVKDIFFNLQIRRQAIFGKGKNDKKTFKKSADSLHSNIVKWAVAHYDLQFILNNMDNSKRIKKMICKSKGYSSPKFVISSLIDPDLIKYLYCFDSDDLFQNDNCNNGKGETPANEVRIWGVICDVARFYHNKKWQLLYINRRCIRHNLIYKSIMDIVLKIHKCLNMNESTNLNINSSLTRRAMFDVPWYKHKQNKHHKHPIFALFIETDPRNIIMENDTKKLHVLIKNESAVLKKLKVTLLRMAQKIYPTLRLMDSWKDEFGGALRDDIGSTTFEFTNSAECKERDVILRNEEEEEEEKLICYDIDNDTENSTATLPLNESCALSTPSASPNRNNDEVMISPSPPWQIARKTQKELYLWSVHKKKKRLFSEMNADTNHNEARKRQRLTQYFGDDLDEMISTNTSFMDDHFPRIPHNLNRLHSKDTESVRIANHQTNDLMNCVISKPQPPQQGLFGFKLPDFNELTHTSDDEGGTECNDCDDNNKKKTQRMMDMIDGEVKLSSILSEWQSNYHVDANSNDAIPIFQFGTENIVISKEDLSNLKLVGVGQMDKKWIVCRLREYILLMDQHAADERVRVERLTSFLVGASGPNSYRIKSRQWNVPCVLYIEYKEMETLKAHAAWIRQWGFDYQVMEQHLKYKIKVFKTPIIYGSAVSVDELREILCSVGCMQPDDITTYIPKCIQRVLASKACRSAIKFGDKLNDKQMRSLMKQVAQCRLPFQCAHGRPTLFPIADLKRFQFDANGDYKIV